jgi:hypothetical protein
MLNKLLVKWGVMVGTVLNLGLVQPLAFACTTCPGGGGGSCTGVCCKTTSSGGCQCWDPPPGQNCNS